ncbi:hypothetical protein GAG18_08145 [Salmonella enterica]|nr:hypothetical protein [Salmonella enterica]
MTTENFSSAQKCVSDHIFLSALKTKTSPKKARFLQRDAGGGRETHCVMSTAEVYAFCAERAISARILMYLSMDQKLCSVYKLLLIYTVFNYNVFDTMCYAGAAS